MTVRCKWCDWPMLDVSATGEASLEIGITCPNRRCLRWQSVKARVKVSGSSVGNSSIAWSVVV